MLALEKRSDRRRGIEGSALRMQALELRVPERRAQRRGRPLVHVADEWFRRDAFLRENCVYEPCKLCGLFVTTRRRRDGGKAAQTLSGLAGPVVARELEAGKELGLGFGLAEMEERPAEVTVAPASP